MKCRHCGDVLVSVKYVDNSFANKQINEAARLMDSGYSSQEIARWFNQVKHVYLEDPEHHWGEEDIETLRNDFYNQRVVPTKRRGVRKATITTSSNSCLGCAVMLLGGMLLLLIPIGTVIGIILLICAGKIMEPDYKCSDCSTKLLTNRARTCPGCSAQLERL